MLLKVYGIKNCDSVRKARRFLKASGIDYEFIDFRETPVSETEIRQWLQKSDLKTLFNTRGTTYRTLKLKEMDLSDEEKIGWMAKENMLIKRPVITTDGQIIVGYNEPEYLEKLPNPKG
jgi:Spx/MgsR family transcriptional regulator